MAYKYIKNFNSKKNSKAYKELMQQRVRRWRKEPAIVKIETPTKIARARSLGWKRKKDFIVVRARLRKGGMRKQRPRQGRKTKGLAVRDITPNVSMQKIAEQRVKRKYQNCKIINSYEVADGGSHKWFEVLLKCQDS